MKPTTVSSSWLSHRYLGLLTALVTLGADQASKVYASTHLATKSVTVVQDFFDFELVHNVGAAFGLFANLEPVWRDRFLIGVALVATLFVVIFLYRTQRLWEAFGLGLVLGGALGNVIDRLRVGWVVDFIHWHWYEYSWPVFNVADVAISAGVAVLLWDTWRPRSK